MQTNYYLKYNSKKKKMLVTNEKRIGKKTG